MSVKKEFVPLGHCQVVSTRLSITTCFVSLQTVNGRYLQADDSLPSVPLRAATKKCYRYVETCRFKTTGSILVAARVSKWYTVATDSKRKRRNTP
jgi:hypothetical protein